jgi:hypothetical protein
MLCVSLRCAFFALCALVAALPAFERGAVPANAETFPGWPAEWEGEPLREVPLSARELQFNSNFPGRIAKFTDGRRELILRWVTQGTRQLHGSSDCFRGMGYAVTPQPGIFDTRRGMWSSFLAQRGGQRLLVRERITDDRGGEWTDVSAWYWSVWLKRSTGPWLAATVAEKLADG